ncbi:MAG: hypothetical protein KDK12_20760 [Rhodobacteraceae bacterium]|nr:hypothetical protein [Paracoccaceae bacterium]
MGQGGPAMDPVTMTYYAAVCAALGYGAGGIRSKAARVILGVAVGVAAAAMLPSLRALAGL